MLSATAVTGALTIAGAGLLTTPASAAGDGGGPTITETYGPANNSSIPYGQVPALGFACADTGGATIIKCSAVDEDGNAFTSGTQVGNGTGVNAGNYSVTISALDTNGNTATLTIAYTVTPLPQTISFLSSPPSPAIYSGHYLVSTSAGGGSGNPVVLSLLQGSGTVCTLTGSTIAFVGVGTCQVGATQAGNIDWAAATPISQTFTVSPTPLTITASSATIFYGQAIPAVTPIYSGFVLGQTASAFSNQPICTVPATGASNAGTYPTSCVGAVDPNYAFTYVLGSLVIKPAPTSLSATPAVISVLPLVPYLFTLNTQLTSNITGKGIPNQPVVFSVRGGAPLGFGITNANGITSDQILLNLGLLGVILQDGYAVTFAGSQNYLPSGSSAQLIEVIPGLIL